MNINDIKVNENNIHMVKIDNTIEVFINDSKVSSKENNLQFSNENLQISFYWILSNLEYQFIIISLKSKFRVIFDFKLFEKSPNLIFSSNSSIILSSLFEEINFKKIIIAEYLFIKNANLILGDSKILFKSFLCTSKRNGVFLIYNKIIVTDQIIILDTLFMKYKGLLKSVYSSIIVEYDLKNSNLENYPIIEISPIKKKLIKKFKSNKFSLGLFGERVLNKHLKNSHLVDKKKNYFW